MDPLDLARWQFVTVTGNVQEFRFGMLPADGAEPAPLVRVAPR